MDHLILQSPLDMHVHLREGDMLRLVAPCTAEQFCGAVIMPNLVEPVDTLDRVAMYRAAVVECCENPVFHPYMTLFFRSYTRAELLAARESIIGVKLYPAGVTTQSEAGVRDMDRIGATLALMEELDIPLLVHGESNGFVMEREHEFLAVYQWMARTFPRLRIVMEHITTAKAVELLDQHSNLAATVTLHHLLITLDDVVGGLLQPDLFCKPIAKTPRDREALQRAVFAGHPRLFFGSDSAPHPRHKKECCGCAAGVFSAPVALPALAQLFEHAGCLPLMQGFVSDHACRFYRLSPPDMRVKLERAPYPVPDYWHNVRVYLSGNVLSWRMVKREAKTVDANRY